MIDELTIYNLAMKYINTIDFVREVEKMTREDVIDECIKLVGGNVKTIVELFSIIQYRYTIEH